MNAAHSLPRRESSNRKGLELRQSQGLFNEWLLN